MHLREFIGYEFKFKLLIHLFQSIHLCEFIGYRFKFKFKLFIHLFELMNFCTFKIKYFLKNEVIKAERRENEVYNVVGSSRESYMNLIRSYKN